MPGTALWYHGGVPGLRRGQQILPPSVTGARVLTTSPHPEGEKWITAVYSSDLVYVTTSLSAARLFASVAPANGGKRHGGDVYEVIPDGPLRPDPDYLGLDGAQMACESATIVRILARRVPRPDPGQIRVLAAVTRAAWESPRAQARRNAVR